MELSYRSWGEGARTALLIHGLSDDASTWWRVAPAIAELGYTVLAPDLRGHGTAARCDSYLLEDFAQDLLETFPAAPDLALGHSLGGLVLGVVAERLGAGRTVFVDPPWWRTSDEVDSPATPESPAWSEAELAVDQASGALLDQRVWDVLLEQIAAVGGIPAPAAPEPGSLVLVPELDPALLPTRHGNLEALGYRVRTQQAVNHVMHRDDLDGYLALLRPELLSVLSG